MTDSPALEARLLAMESLVESLVMALAATAPVNPVDVMERIETIATNLAERATAAPEVVTAATSRIEAIFDPYSADRSKFDFDGDFGPGDFTWSRLISARAVLMALLHRVVPDEAERQALKDELFTSHMSFPVRMPSPEYNERMFAEVEAGIEELFLTIGAAEQEEAAARG